MKRTAAIRQRLQSLRSRYVAALEAMDYRLALTYQIEIDTLQGELDARRQHHRLMARQHKDYVLSG